MNENKSRAAKKEQNHVLHVILENNSNSPSAPSSLTSKPLTSNAYQSRWSFGTVLSRTQKSLPISPRKRVAMVAALANHIGLTIENQKTQNDRKSQQLTDKTRTVVSSFYFCPGIYTMPRIDDTVTVWKN